MSHLPILPRIRRPGDMLPHAPAPASELPAHRLSRGSSAVLPWRSPMDVIHLKPGDPAVRATTDFARQAAFTVTEDRLLEDALDSMFRFGVRALLTLRDGEVSGLITADDIQNASSRPPNSSEEQVPRPEIRVGSVRRAWSALPTIDWTSLQAACVGDLLKTFEGIKCSHLIVLESRPGCVLLRGIVSRSRLQRQVERPI